MRPPLNRGTNQVPPIPTRTSAPQTDSKGVNMGQMAAQKVKSGLNDLKSKLSQMKEQKERAEAEMLKELEEYNRRQKSKK
mmetsp:Transcript_2301/g.3939  ORF Transcript_2301/g.3939 Transcript_2301/m.3939 type:complete len:80 (+) Transcript_2301:194-433(+)